LGLYFHNFSKISTQEESVDKTRARKHNEDLSLVFFFLVKKSKLWQYKQIFHCVQYDKWGGAYPNKKRLSTNPESRFLQNKTLSNPATPHY